MRRSRRAVSAAAGFAGHTLRWIPGIAAAACLVVAGWMVAMPVGLVVAGAFCLWADWRLQ